MGQKQTYVVLATRVQARINCLTKDSDPQNWAGKHEDRIEEIMRDFPHGSGFDNGTTIDLGKSTGDKLIFHTSFHHMNDVGMYDGWTEHTVTVRPSLQHGFRVVVGGRNRNQIKDMISEAFYDALRKVIDDGYVTSAPQVTVLTETDVKVVDSVAAELFADAGPRLTGDDRARLADIIRGVLSRALKVSEANIDR
jgi:hypothetical protein